MSNLNKKGQSLIMFIIFLPIFLISLALIVDVGLMYNAKIKGEGLLKECVEDNLDIEDYFKINDINVESVEKGRNNSEVCDIISFRIDSVFGNLVGYKSYLIEVTNCEKGKENND